MPNNSTPFTKEESHGTAAMMKRLNSSGSTLSSGLMRRTPKTINATSVIATFKKVLFIGEPQHTGSWARALATVNKVSETVKLGVGQRFVLGECPHRISKCSRRRFMIRPRFAGGYRFAGTFLCALLPFRL